MEAISNITWDGFSLRQRREVPEGLWMRCPECENMVFRKTVVEEHYVCPECGHHFRIGARERIEQICDPNTFEEFCHDLEPSDPLNFHDRMSYKDRLRQMQEKTQLKEAVVTGKGFVKGRPIILAVMDSNFLMATMGSVVGEKITIAIERAQEQNLPLVVFSCSGGARMQEGALSLMQMAKTSAALGRYDEAGGLFISVLTDPTTGGVTASFAMLGDVILGEPRALIGFAGPRTIWHTIKVELPEGFQRAEFLLEHGLIDMIVPRRNLRSEIARIIDYCGK